MILKTQPSLLSMNVLSHNSSAAGPGSAGVSSAGYGLLSNRNAAR